MVIKLAKMKVSPSLKLFHALHIINDIRNRCHSMFHNGILLLPDPNLILQFSLRNIPKVLIRRLMLTK